MKFNIKRKELGKQSWQAVWPVILGALGSDIVAVTGCSSMQPSQDAGHQSMGACLFSEANVLSGDQHVVCGQDV